MQRTCKVQSAQQEQIILVEQILGRFAACWMSIFHIKGSEGTYELLFDTSTYVIFACMAIVCGWWNF
jgi:hypothetical protein